MWESDALDQMSPWCPQLGRPCDALNQVRACDALSQVRACDALNQVRACDTLNQVRACDALNQVGVYDALRNANYYDPIMLFYDHMKRIWKCNQLKLIRWVKNQWARPTFILSVWMQWGCKCTFGGQLGSRDIIQLTCAVCCLLVNQMFHFLQVCSSATKMGGCKRGRLCEKHCFNIWSPHG